jgi:hypothetical protein
MYVTVVVCRKRHETEKTPAQRTAPKRDGAVCVMALKFENDF